MFEAHNAFPYGVNFDLPRFRDPFGYTSLISPLMFIILLLPQVTTYILQIMLHLDKYFLVNTFCNMDNLTNQCLSEYCNSETVMDTTFEFMDFLDTCKLHYNEYISI